MGGRSVVLAVAGCCLLGVMGSYCAAGWSGPEYITSAGTVVQEEVCFRTSRTLREKVQAPENIQNLAVCQAADYVNIRQQATTASAVVGKIHRNAAADILATVNGEGGSWYQIQSGTVNGYVKASYFLTGVQAEAAAREVGICYAMINTAALRLRERPDVSSPALTTLRQGSEYIMLGEENHFARLAVDETLTGYVSMDYIKTRMVYPQAVSLAEEAAQQAEEARRQQEAQAALQKLEEVKLVEAKGDSGGGGSFFAPVQVIPGQTEAVQGTLTGLPGQTEAVQGTLAGFPGQTETVQGTLAGLPGQKPPSSGMESVPVTIAANPLGQGDNPQVAPPGTTPTLAAAAVVSPYGPGSAENVYSEGTTSLYGPGGSASQELVSAARTALVAYAKQFLGYPYVYGGDSLTNGTDCSGFVMRIFEHFGINTGRNSREQAANGRQIAIEAVKPGDLLFYASGDTINHVAIYIGGGQVIHAASAKTGIIISPADYRTACRAVSFFD